MSAATDFNHPLIRVLRDPLCARELDARAWEALLRAARRGFLLSHVATRIERHGLLPCLPAKVALHLQSALRVGDSQARTVRHEIECLRQALGGLEAPFILLKGAAYIAGGFNAGAGRLLSDIDIMVERRRLDAAEKALLKAGWFPTKLNVYDQRYYREWMHELPPMQHLERGTMLDVHHTILPPTALMKPDAMKLWQAARALGNDRQIRVLAPADMVLHSAAHLFHEGEFDHGLRDLVDIDALVRQFESDPGFWAGLRDRALELDLVRPLHYALHFAQVCLRTPVPAAITAAVAQAAAPSALVARLMETAVRRSLGAIFRDRESLIDSLARFAMYVRSHYLRMPLRLLIPHLLRKQFVAEAERR